MTEERFQLTQRHYGCRPLNASLPMVAKQIAYAPHLLVGLDYDGTLTPLVDSPDNAILDPLTREAIRSLAVRPDTTVAILSGRPLDDVRNRIAVPGVIYAGNHGMEISGPGVRFVEPAAVAMMSLIDTISRFLTAQLQPIAGAIVENKSLTMSIHYRCVAAKERERLRKIVEDAVLPQEQHLRLTKGHMVYEVRPRVDWHKGYAMCWIHGQLRTRLSVASNPLAIYVGDDETDEDVFRSLSDGIGIKVGEPKMSSAHYFLETPSQVREFVCWLSQDANYKVMECHNERS